LFPQPEIKYSHNTLQSYKAEEFYLKEDQNGERLLEIDDERPIPDEGNVEVALLEKLGRKKKF